MNTDIAIRSRGLGKKYIIGHQARSERYTTLRDTVVRAARSLFSGGNATTLEEFWALRDIDFEIGRGEVFGIVGKNGAGKSTLLKVLSRITEPTKGRVEISGRVASLLEVGTGFHPELSGRENVFLNGSILGMSRPEIHRKLDEIVAFAEVEQFLDTPVKKYSSGMYVRLAFSVAAHLEPDILIVDEVLAVGDLAFQQKCLGKLDGVARQSHRTVLFVSHNMQAVQSLCGKAILLERGRLTGIGPAAEIIQTYVNKLDATETEGATMLGPSLQLQQLQVLPAAIVSGAPASFVIEINALRRTVLKCMQLLIYSDVGVRVAILDLRLIGLVDVSLPGGPLSVRLEVPSLPLLEGRYRLGLYILDSDHLANYLDLAVLTVSQEPGKYDFVPSEMQYRGYMELKFAGSFSRT